MRFGIGDVAATERYVSKQKQTAMIGRRLRTRAIGIGTTPNQRGGGSMGTVDQQGRRSNRATGPCPGDDFSGMRETVVRRRHEGSMSRLFHERHSKKWNCQQFPVV